jgi:hypothetical protein
LPTAARAKLEKVYDLWGSPWHAIRDTIAYLDHAERVTASLADVVVSGPMTRMRFPSTSAVYRHLRHRAAALGGAVTQEAARESDELWAALKELDRRVRVFEARAGS